MATLTKGMSYRRQGSSGLIWADNMVVTEDGVFAMARQTHKSAGFSRMDASSGTASVMGRSKSVGSGTSASLAAAESHHKTGVRVVKWLKKAITKMRK